MAKTVGRACAQIAIILTIYGSIQNVKSISPELYNTVATRLTYINPDEIVRLMPVQSRALRPRRAAVPTAPAELTPVVATITQDAKNQYRSVNGNGNVNISSSSSGGGGIVSSADAATLTTTMDSKASTTGSVSYNVHNFGVNGTGQRKDLSSGSDAVANNNSSITTSINVATGAGAGATGLPAVPLKKTQLMASLQPSPYPKKAPSSVQMPMATGTSTERQIIDDVDVADDVINDRAKNQSLTRREDHFFYYQSLFYVNKNETTAMWNQVRLIPENTMLSSAHRRAMTVELKFDFPFYGQYVRNITVATGGFLFTGVYVHSWLAATQYIAPLMANFDTSISNDSFVRLQDNGTAFTVVWENVTLQDKPEYGKFTFSVTLHQNGDIVFVYYQLPTVISNIQDNQHPVKVGLSDAYIVDKMLFFARRKTIYEYHRVTFGQTEITNATLIKLTAQPTCLRYNDCESCLNHNTTFECAWCPTLNRCSTHNGTDRGKQEWQQKGCDRLLISKTPECPALGQKGNNAAQENISNNNNNSTSNNNSSSNNNNNNNTGGISSSSTPASNGAAATATEPTVSSTQFSPANGEQHNSDGVNVERSEHLGAVQPPENKSVGVAFRFIGPICLVFAVTLWLFYAYRNPHTRSGQLLIQFRPSQWSWRRGEARYTAATIHM
ncbi:plexin domain-containing protein 1 isoform X2 [Drosophila grimshawi]|uniref:GH12720 n=1 Tax=Drosophila grimshawi TaxID=7222 RepID=B4JKR2_DROGR|nr:plexin domain-containing protein 1 isoform X2 [Drosophila grimshawi]EDW00165.1 GH12720 [Drosophila grimshawi]